MCYAVSLACVPTPSFNAGLLWRGGGGGGGQVYLIWLHGNEVAGSDTLLDRLCESLTSRSLHPDCELLCKACALHTFVHSIRDLRRGAAAVRPALSPGVPQQGLQAWMHDSSS